MKIMALKRQKGNFADAYEQAKDAPATTRDLLRERITQGVGSDACYPGAWTTENFNCIQGNIYGCLAEFNPLIPYRNKAVDPHRDNREFYLTPDIILNGKSAIEVILEIVEQDKKKLVGRKRVINLGKTQTHNVPTDSLADDNGIVFLARSKKLAKEYCLFLRNQAGIQQITFYFPLIQTQDYARGFWLDVIGLGSRSYFSGVRNLNDTYGSLFRVRGGKSGKATQKKIPQETKVLPCTEEQLKTYLEIAQGINQGRLGTAQAGKLEELILGLMQFLNNNSRF